MYQVYLDEMLLPIPPQKVQMKYRGQNKTVNLINGEECSVLHAPGLCEISFDAVIPQSDYPFAVWDGSIDDAGGFIERLKALMEDKASFEFLIIRDGPGDLEFFDTNLAVTLEDFSVSDDVKEGMDLCVSINLKEYRHCATKIMNFTIKEEQPVLTETESQKERTEPEPPKSYAVVSGDCLWKIAKKVLGDGTRWREIYERNRDKINNPDVIHPGQILIMP